MNLSASMGLTSVHTNDEKSLHVYQHLQQTQQLPIRVFLTPNLSDLDLSTDQGGVGECGPFRSSTLLKDRVSPALSSEGLGECERLTVERVKIFSDGSLGAETAALRTAPPSDRSTTSTTAVPSTGFETNVIVESAANYSGILYYPDDTLCQQIKQAKSRGFRLEVHCIGDAAAEQVC